MSAETATLVAAGVAAAASIVTLVLNSRLTYDRERRQALLRKDIDRLTGLEELAGRAIELVGSYQGVEEKAAVLPDLVRSLDDAAGQFARYQPIRQAVRDLSQACKVLLSAQRRHEDDRAARAELDPCYRRLTQAIDGVLRPRFWTRPIKFRQ